MSLNEKLRYDLMKLCGFWTVEIPDAHRDIVRKKGDNGGFITICWWDDWNPTTDLNQLRECYLAAEDSWNSHNDTPFRVVFAESMKPLLKESFGDDFIDWDTLLLLWVKHPELVAQAILKAKGVEV